ncbi:MAG TPA: protein jag [Epsilonproteobacteria bacterium]|nr:protein jag [Campylobacterota bacterium]
MKKIEAPTLADAYEQAARELSCSITELQYEVIQHPSSGVMGFFKKNAIIVAECSRAERDNEKIEDIVQSIAAEEIIEEILEAGTLLQSESETETSSYDEASKEEMLKISKEPAVTVERDKPALQKEDQPNRAKNRLDEEVTQWDDAVLDSFFEVKETIIQERPKNNNLELAEKIEAELAELLSHSCFGIDTVEVDVVENTALIFIDGDDAALLIGKEGYRYNALSYMLFNWLHTKYDLYVKLEIAQFLTTQQEMIRHYIQPVIEFVNENGRGKTRPLDGILVQIALEQLRDAFPNKYVAVKTGRDGRKFVIINEFNTKKHA